MHWWIELGYPAFDEGKNGFPKTGQVIKYYRVKKREGQKSMPQSKAAAALGITPRAIKYMESRDEELSMERRQALCKLLNIPPVLFGIVTIEEVGQLIEKKATEAGPVDIEGNKQFLEEAHALHQHSTAVLLLNLSKLKLETLYRQLPNTNSYERPQVHELLYSYHIFMSGELRELQQYGAAMAHLDMAMDMANLLNDDTLRTVCQLHRVRILETIGRIREGVEIFDMTRLSKESHELRGLGLCYMSHLYADIATTETDKRAAMAILERGGTIVRAHPEPVYIYGLDSSLQAYYLRKAHTLTGIGWGKEAIRTLDLMQCDTNTWPRYYRDLYTAQAYLKLGKLELVIPCAEECLKIARKFASPMNIARVQSIYDRLVARKYRGSDMAALGRLLKA